MNSIVDVGDVWKKFPMKREKPGFKEFLLTLPKFVKRNTGSYFWALKGINFQVQHRECLGIIGKNGSGKSTLLSLILGTIYPTNGAIKVSQNTTPLLELGAGFRKHFVQSLGLIEAPGEAVQYVAFFTIVFFEALIDHSDDDIIRYECAFIHEFLGFQTHGSSILHGSPEHITC